MKQKIKNIVLALTIALTGSMVYAPALVSADLKQDACQGVNALNGSDSKECSKDADGSVHHLEKTVIQILSVVVGFIAVIMVIIGGLRLITANGDPGGVAAARTSIVYALIGLIIVAIAQVLVHFVIFRTS